MKVDMSEQDDTAAFSNVVINDMTPVEISMDDAIENIGFGIYQIAFMVLAGVTWAFDAVFSMSTSLMLPLIIRDYDVGMFLEFSLLSALFFGSLIGASLFGYLADKFGRKYGFLFTATLSLFFGVVAAGIGNLWVLLVCLFFIGLGVGSAAVCFTSFAEIIPSGTRGMTLILFESFWGIGNIWEVLVAWVLLKDADDWRLFFYISSLPMGVIILLWIFIPESPRYYLSSGNVEGAKKTLKLMLKVNNIPRRLLGLKLKTIAPDGMPFELMQHSVAEDEDELPLTIIMKLKAKVEVLNVLFSRKYLITTLLLILIWFTNTFVYYGLIFLTPLYFSSAGDTGNNYLLILLSTLAEEPGLLAAFLLIETLGRKRTQMVCFFICGISLAFLLLHNVDFVPIYILVVFAFIARGSIVAAFDTTYIYTPECYPTHVRATALGIFNSVSRLSGIIAPTIPYIFAGNNTIVISLFSILSIIASFCAMLMPIRTAGKRLDDI